MNNTTWAEPATDAPTSSLKQANQAFRQADFAAAVRLYVEALQTNPALVKTIATNLTVARQKYRDQARPQRRVALITPAGNPAADARAKLLAGWQAAGDEIDRHLHGERREPDSAAIALVLDDKNFPQQAIRHVATWPYDIVYLVNPSALNILLGILYKLLWDATVIVDMHDAVDGAGGPVDSSVLPSLDELSAPQWCHWAQGLATEFDGLTVADHALHARFGGVLLEATSTGGGAALPPQKGLGQVLKSGLVQSAQAMASWLTPVFQNQLAYRSLRKLAADAAGVTTGDALVRENPHANWWRTPFLKWQQPRPTFAIQSGAPGSDDAVLRNFGAAFLGPVLAAFFSPLSEQFTSQGTPPVLHFLAREGYFLELVYRKLAENKLIPKTNSTYLLCSRTLLFKLSLAKPSLWGKLLNHHYHGNLNAFFKNRFAFTDAEIEEIKKASPSFRKNAAHHIDLPANKSQVLTILREASSTLEAITKPKLEAYRRYLDGIGFGQNGREHMIDLGYAGTIQSLLSDLTRTPTAGHYFMTTPKAKNTELTQFKGYLYENISFGSKQPLLDRSLYLESMLTAPHGSVIDIADQDGKISFQFGSTTMAQEHFGSLESVLAGAADYALHAMRYRLAMEPAELSDYYDKFVSHGANFPASTWELFEIDDAISGFGLLNPFQFFKKNQPQ